MELKKSYRGLALWVAGFCAAAALAALLPFGDYAIASRAVFGVTAVSIALLAWIIWRTQYVYWYNGVSYAQAVEAGEARRRAYALKHLKRFAGFAALFLPFSALMQLLGAGIWIDTTALCLGLVAVALSTLNIRL